MPLLSQRVLAALEAVFVTIRGRLVMPPIRLLTRPLSNVILQHLTPQPQLQQLPPPRDLSSHSIFCVEINNLQCAFALKIIETLASGLLLITNKYTSISNRCFLIEVYQLYDIPTVWYQSPSQEPIIQNMLRTAYQQRALRYHQFSHPVLCI